ncbi:hypothetical protein [Spirillospora sp. NPDC047279]|uniref:hypothetical protein n=1 Tax=Spirillospora sp. NPDC047279 TaxID=3155478 RepID=UPI0033D2E4A5
MDKFDEAKVNYRGFQVGNKCLTITTSVEESCWYGQEKGLSLVMRRGYFVVSLTATAINSPALQPGRRPMTSRKLVTDIAGNLPS